MGRNHLTVAMALGFMSGMGAYYSLEKLLTVHAQETAVPGSNVSGLSPQICSEYDCEREKDYGVAYAAFAGLAGMTGIYCATRRKDE